MAWNQSRTSSLRLCVSHRDGRAMAHLRVVRCTCKRVSEHRQPYWRANGTNYSTDNVTGSAPDVDMTLTSRKTPRLPPPRQSTPKHTNIGSPKRASTGRPVSQRLSGGVDADGSPARLSKTQPPPNRVLDFGANGVRTSIENASPFKPKRVIRRSSVGPRPNLFASPVRAVRPAEAFIETEKGADAGAEQGTEALAQEEIEVQQAVNDGPLLLDDDDYNTLPQQTVLDAEEAQADETHETPTKRKPGRPRKSVESLHNSHIDRSRSTVSAASSRKRDRSTLEDEQIDSGVGLSHSQLGEAGTARKRPRGRSSRDNSIHVHQDYEEATLDPTVLARGESYVTEGSVDTASEPPTKGKGKGRKGKTAAPKKSDANRAMRASGSPVKINDLPSKLRNSRAGSRGASVGPNSRAGSRGTSIGPSSNVNLRASTPFEDAGERTSRFGRNLIQPLKYWANESRIYKHGQIEGIVRADEVEGPRRKKPKRRGRKPGKGNGISRLEDIDEESDAESTFPEEWEEEHGVIAGLVANWNPETQSGVPEDLVREGMLGFHILLLLFSLSRPLTCFTPSDLGFAHSSIITRDVAGSDFKYAKIMTLPFFGSGVVEVPPEGYKRAKNSRKMQMCFFVHEGKVLVEVGAAGTGETNQFAISKGGVWVVPRGEFAFLTVCVDVLGMRCTPGSLVWIWSLLRRPHLQPLVSELERGARLPNASKPDRTRTHSTP